MMKVCRIALLAGIATVPTLGAQAQVAATPDPVGQGVAAPSQSASPVPDAPEGSHSGGLQEIVVTAQRRSERLQDVPVAVTAFGSAALAARNVTDLRGIDGLAPNVKFASPAGYPSYTAVAIRGAYELNTAPFYDQPTGVYVDGVFIGKAQGSLFDIADIQSVEVLRGPQGTLFGRNTLAGAVNITTRKPSGQFKGSIDGTIGDYGQRRVRASVDLPKVGPLSVSLSGLLNRNSGYFHNRDTPYAAAASFLPVLPRTTDSFDAVNSKSFRVAAHLDIATGLTADYTFDYSHQNNRPGMAQVTHIGSGEIFDPASPSYVGIPIYLYVQPDRQSTGYLNGGVDNSSPIDRVRTQGQALTLAWTSGPTTIKSITAYRTQHYLNALDLDGSPYPLAAANIDSHYRSFSQEVQATGSVGRLKYTGGLYYFWDHGRVDNPQQFFGQATTTVSRYGFGTDAWAAYGQADWTPPILDDKLTVTGGIRYSSEGKSGSRSLGSEPTGTDDVTYSIPPGTHAHTRFHSVTPTAILKYSFSRDFNIYAKYAKGFKSGGFGGEASTIDEAVRPFRPETVDTYEIGLKSELLDRKLRINAAAFWNERKNMQLSVFTGFVGGLAVTSIRNAGQARVRGFELETQALPTDWFSITASLGYLDGKFSKLVEADPVTGAPINVASDREFPVVPKWTGNVSVDTRLFRKGDLELHSLIDFTHSDKSFQGAYSPEIARLAPLDGYNHFDWRFRLTGIATPAGKLELGAWVRNLTNEQHRTGGFDFGSAFGDLTLGYFNPPRTFGFDAGLKF